MSKEAEVQNAEKCWIENPSTSYWDEEDAYVNPSKGLLFLAKKYEFGEAISKIQPHEKSRPLLFDDHHRTAAHYAAMHQDGEQALQQLVQHLGPACLFTPDVDSITPLHLSARYHSARSWMKNFKLISCVRLSQFTDSNGDTCAHWAARNAKDPRMVLAVKQKAVTICWKWTNNRNVTVLQHVLQFCQDNSVVKEIMDGIDAASDMLRTQDIDGNSVAHYAARSKIDAIGHKTWLESLGIGHMIWSRNLSNNSWLTSGNAKGETVLQLALQNCSKEVASKLIEKASSLNPKWYEMKDKQGNTCLHALAQCQGRDVVLLEAVDAAIGQRPQQTDSRSPPRTTDFSQTGSNGSSTAQPAQTNRRQPQSLFVAASYKSNQASNAADSNCLFDQNKRKATVLHYAIENCEAETVHTLLARFKTFRNFLIGDKAGNTIFHIAAKRSDKGEILTMMLQLYGVLWENVAVNILSKKNHKNQSVLHLAIDALELEGIIEKISKDVFKQKDKAGNTLLHSLMQSRLNYEGVDEFILSRFKLLVDKKVKATDANNLSQNCLHATKLDAQVLCKLLDKISSDEKATEIFGSLLVNSDTKAHIVHTFSGQYNLESMLDPIQKVSNKSKDDLIKSQVNPENCGNAEHGETCLHFACAYGHRKNIVFLLEKGLSLWAQTHSGQTCVDCAFENGNFDDLAQAIREYNAHVKNLQNINEASETTCNEDLNKGTSSQIPKEIKMIDIWRLLDPRKRALKLPDRQVARQILVSITNDFGTTQLTTDLGIKKQKMDRMVLLRAIEMDSRKIFRAALSLEMITRETETFFIDYFQDTLQVDEGIRRAFLRQNMFKHRTHIDSASELPLVDLASFFYREEILPDFILTRQFELIPCCLSLLIQLDPEIKKMRAKAKGKHEQLLLLQKKVTNIAVNALNELFVNADSAEIELLFKYIKGEMAYPEVIHAKRATKSHTSYFGPKFPYRISDGKNSRIEYGSVLDLVEVADCPDLFATDCIYSLTNEDWRQPILKCSQRDGASQDCMPWISCLKRCICRPKISKYHSPRAKFWMHTIGLLVFLGFLGWYVLNFQISFPRPGVDAVLVAYILSFVMQEISEIWRQRDDREKCKIGPYIISVPSYIADLLNIFDVFGILFLFAGLSLRWYYYLEGFKLEDAYPSQMVLSTSFALFCIRSVSFLSFFEAVGPMISMLWSLILYDLIPFLAILFVIFGSFGVFFTCLLFSFAWAPTAHVDNPYYGWEVFVQAATLPFNLLFSNFDQIKITSSPDSTKLGEVAIKEGYEWFYYLLLFIFMGLVNVVMMNLLIALFNLRVTQMYGVAIGIWRRKYFTMLQEYRKMSWFPPPFSFLVYSYYFLRFLCRCCCNSTACSSKNVIGDDSDLTSKMTDWWLDRTRYPTDYKRFLEFQAIQFRRCRSRLLRDTQWNRNDFDVVKAHTGNELSDFKSEMMEMIDDLKHEDKEGDHKLEELMKQQQLKTEDKMKRLRYRIKGIDSKLEQVLALVQQQHGASN